MPENAAKEGFQVFYVTIKGLSVEDYNVYATFERAKKETFIPADMLGETTFIKVCTLA